MALDIEQPQTVPFYDSLKLYPCIVSFYESLKLYPFMTASNRAVS